jgi:hypothetical protein
LAGNRWIGETNFQGRKLGLFLVSIGADLEEDIVDAAVQRIADLERVVPVARKFLSSTGVSDAIARTLEFSGLSVFRAHPDWVSNLAAVSSITSGKIVWSLQFSSSDDLNVHEVIFFGEEPIEADYH